MVLKNSNHPMQGEIWLFDPDPIRGNEIGKKIRPCLIISNDLWNKNRSGLVIVIPLTRVDKEILTHIKMTPPEGGLNVESFVMCEQIRSISRERLIKKMGQVTQHQTLESIESWIHDLIKIGISS